MVINRRNSLVQSIASQPNDLAGRNISDVLDDSYLFERLQKLSLVTATKNGSTPQQSPTNSSDSTHKSDEDIVKYQPYINYIDELDGNLKKYRTIVEDTKQIETLLNSTVNSFTEISKGSSLFISDTRTLYNKHAKFHDLSTKIPQYLRYFDSLDQVMRALRHSTSSNVVRKDSFKKMLSSIDESLLFLDAHPDLLDAESYRAKFKQCLVRALDMVSHYVLGLLDQIQQEITEKSSKITDYMRDVLIYNKYASISEDFRCQVVEIVKRFVDPRFKRYSNEIGSILDDCFTHYFTVRTKMLTPIIWAQLDSTILKNKNGSLLLFLQENKSYLQQLSSKEYKLFTDFFTEIPVTKRAVNKWFITLYKPFYSTVSGHIIRETDIDTLCDSIMLFSSFYELEEDSEEYKRRFNQVEWDKVFQPVLTSIQETLIGRIHMYVDQNITKYVPTRDDFIISNRKLKIGDTTEKFLLTYINKFNSKQNLDDLAFEEAGSLSEDGNKNMDAAENIRLVTTYYIPLVKALAILFRIVDLVGSALFEELLNSILHSAVMSLRVAREVMSRERRQQKRSVTSSDTLDTRLFYMKNLLFLKDEVQNFNLDPTADKKSSISASASTERLLRSYKSKNSFFFSFTASLGSKSKSNTTTDARLEIVEELRCVIKEITKDASDIILGHSLDSESKNEEEIISANEELLRNVEPGVRATYGQITASLGVTEISSHLIEAIQEFIGYKYTEYYTAINDRVIAGKLQESILSRLPEVEVFTDMLDGTIRRLSVGSVVE